MRAAPAKDSIDFETRPFQQSVIYLPNGTMNPNQPTNFNGDPRPELEDAWRRIMGREQTPFLSSLVFS
jgi:hypothetical protein